MRVAMDKLVCVQIATSACTSAFLVYSYVTGLIVKGAGRGAARG